MPSPGVNGADGNNGVGEEGVGISTSELAHTNDEAPYLILPEVIVAIAEELSPEAKKEKRASEDSRTSNSSNHHYYDLDRMNKANAAAVAAAAGAAGAAAGRSGGSSGDNGSGSSVTRRTSLQPKSPNDANTNKYLRPGSPSLSPPAPRRMTQASSTMSSTPIQKGQPLESLTGQRRTWRMLLGLVGVVISTISFTSTSWVKSPALDVGVWGVTSVSMGLISSCVSSDVGSQCSNYGLYLCVCFCCLFLLLFKPRKSHCLLQCCTSLLVRTWQT